MKWRIVFQVFLTGLAVLGNLAGFSSVSLASDSVCRTDAEETRKACSTEDLAAGMTDGGSEAQRLVGEIKKLNGETTEDRRDRIALVKRTNGESESDSAIQCKIQMEVSKRLARLSDLKAQACQATIDACRKSCSSETTFHDALSSGWAALGEDDASSQHSSKASEKRDGEEQCYNNTRNAEAARKQKQERENGERTNKQCLALSSVDPAVDVAATTSSPSAATHDGSHVTSQNVGTNGHRAFASNEVSSAGRAGPIPFKNSDSTSASTNQGRALRSDDGHPILNAQKALQVRDINSAKVDRPSIFARLIGFIGGSSKTSAKSKNKSAAMDSQLQGSKVQTDGLINVRKSNGITSAAGLSLWQKVSAQYQRQAPFLLTDSPLQRQASMSEGN